MPDPVYGLAWQARSSNGAIEYNSLRVPTPAQAKAEITTLDASDLRYVVCQGAPPLDVDGGTTDGVLEPLISPLNADGGTLS